MEQQLQQQVADRIERLIDLGEFPVGERLPGHRALATRFDVSNAVIRGAQSLLIARDRVRVRPKSGVYAVGRPPHRTRMSLSTNVRRNPLGYLFNRHSGRWPAVAKPTREIVICPAELVGLLQLDEGDRVWARRRVVGPVVGTASQPLQITTTYLPLWLVEEAPELAAEDTGPGGYLDVIEHALGYGPVRWPTAVYPRLPTAQEALDLDMPERQPVLVEERLVVHPPYDRPLAVDVAVRDGRLWALTYDIERDPTAAWPTVPATERNVLSVRADTPKPVSPAGVPAGSAPKG